MNDKTMAFNKKYVGNLEKWKYNRSPEIIGASFL